MPLFKITNVQLRNARGSLLGAAPDFEVHADSTSDADVCAAVAQELGNDNASFSWDLIA